MILSKITNNYFDNSPVLYRLNNLITGGNYIGLASYGLNNRLFNNKYGYLKIPGEFPSSLESAPDILLNINLILLKYGIENFDLSIEGVPSSDLNEEILIRNYDSVRNGYNKTLDGLGLYRTKYKLISVNNGILYTRLPELYKDYYISLGLMLGGPSRGDTAWFNDGENEYQAHNSRIQELDSLGYSRGRLSESSIKGKIAINNGVSDRYISKGEEIPEGYNIGKLSSPVKGKIVMNKGGSVIYVSSDEVKSYELNGWKLGRGENSSFKNKKIINNGVHEITVNLDELKYYLDEGYSLGHLPGFISKQTGKIAVNNGVEYKVIDSDELEEYLKLGYSKGGLKNNKHNTIGGKITVNNGSVNKMIFPNELDKYINLGYSKGRVKRK